MGALHGVGLARAQLAVDLGQGLVAVLAQVLLQGVDDEQPGLVLGREEDLERLALADEQVEGRVADLLAALDLALDAGQGVGALEVLAVDGHPDDAGVAHLLARISSLIFLRAPTRTAPVLGCLTSSAAVLPTRPSDRSQ